MSSVKTFATFGVSCALLLAAGLLSIVAVHRFDVKAAALPRGQKTYSRTLVEGLSVSRHGLYGVDSDRFLAVRGVAPKFSGLRINGLSVSRLTDEDKPEVAFTAKSAEAVRGGLKLSGCVVHEEGRPPVPVSGAMLARCDRKLCLIWNGGKIDLN